MERAEIAELFYNALINLNDLERLERFLSTTVQWTLSAADPHTVGEESPPKCHYIFREGRLPPIGVVLPKELKSVFRRSHRLY
jgi:hypothetical protein